MLRPRSQSRSRPRPRPRPAQAGFAYIALLFGVALLSTAMAGAAVIWSTMQQREKEEQLLFIGGEIRRAIGAYYQATPGPAKRYPPTLDALLRDKRQIALRRYLRREYGDPMTNEGQWILIMAPDRGVMGVYSASEKQPIRKSFDIENQDFTGTRKYSDWRFVYLAPAELPGAR